MGIVPYKQTLSHSCLAVCLLMLRGKRFTEAEEHELAFNGSKRVHEFYVAGIPLEFVRRYGTHVILYVDNQYFAKILRRIFSKKKNIHIVQEKITQKLIVTLLDSGPLICHIDNNSLGDYSHASHFIVLETATDTFVSIIDPWTGTRRKVSLSKITDGIRDLKKIIKMCPLLISINV